MKGIPHPKWRERKTTGEVGWKEPPTTDPWECIVLAKRAQRKKGWGKPESLKTAHALWPLHLHGHPGSHFEQEDNHTRPIKYSISSSGRSRGAFHQSRWEIKREWWTMKTSKSMSEKLNPISQKFRKWRLTGTLGGWHKVTVSITRKVTTKEKTTLTSMRVSLRVLLSGFVIQSSQGLSSPFTVGSVSYLKQ